MSSLYVPRPQAVALPNARLNLGLVPEQGTALPAHQQSAWSQAPALSGVATQMPLTRKRYPVLNSKNPHTLEPPYVPSFGTCEWGPSRHRNTAAARFGGVVGTVLATRPGPGVADGEAPCQRCLPGLAISAGSVARPAIRARCRGVSQDIGMAWPARSPDVEGTPCHHRCCHRGPLAG